jgi:acyl dehydratase
MPAATSAMSASAPVTIPSLGALKDLVGREVALTDWVEISQQRIDLFAEATGDHQWIHTDPARAAAESPFGSTIAHGFLTLSLLPHFLSLALRMEGVRMGVNYGLNRLRFTAPAPVGSRLRARFTLAAVEDIAGGAQTTWAVSVEREGSDKPVCVAEWLTRRYE